MDSASTGFDAYLRKYRRGLVNSLLEYLILNYIEETPLCGYDIITLVASRFKTLLSPGQVYPVIETLARNGLLQKSSGGRKTLLTLTNMGHAFLKTWRSECESIFSELHNPVTMSRILR
jgi:DNA-binding PadR family transcriptional regulator